MAQLEILSSAVRLLYGNKYYHGVYVAEAVANADIWAIPKATDRAEDSCT